MTYPPQPHDPYQSDAQPPYLQPPVVSGPPVSPEVYGRSSSPVGYGQPMSPGPYGQPYPQQPVYQQVAVVQALPTSGWSIASMIFGILGMLGGFCFFGIPCIVAVICGHVGLNETKGGGRSGRGMAIAGLILGYLFVAPAIVVIVGGGVGAVLPSSITP